MEVHCHPWTLARIYSAQEDHGNGKHLIRVRYQLRLSPFAKTLSALVVVVCAISTAFNPAYGGVIAGMLFGSLLGIWWRGATLAGRVASALNGLTSGLGLIRCEAE